VVMAAGAEVVSLPEEVVVAIGSREEEEVVVDIQIEGITRVVGLGEEEAVGNDRALGHGEV